MCDWHLREWKAQDKIRSIRGPDYIRYANKAQLDPFPSHLWVLEVLQGKKPEG